MPMISELAATATDNTNTTDNSVATDHVAAGIVQPSTRKRSATCP